MNNTIEADYDKLKHLTNPVRGLKSMKTAYATINGFKLMRMFKKFQLELELGQGLTGEIRLVESSSVSVRIINHIKGNSSGLVFFATEPYYTQVGSRLPYGALCIG